MTMRVHIRNDDATGKIRVTSMVNGSTTGSVAEIKPGEGGEYWIHSGLTLTVEEVPYVAPQSDENRSE